MEAFFFFRPYTSLNHNELLLSHEKLWYSCMDKLGPHCAVRSQLWKAMCCGSMQLA